MKMFCNDRSKKKQSCFEQNYEVSEFSNYFILMMQVQEEAEVMIS